MKPRHRMLNGCSLTVHAHKSSYKKTKRAAQETTAASRSRLADWPDAGGTHEKTAFPREEQTTDRALTESSQTTT